MQIIMPAHWQDKATAAPAQQKADICAHYAAAAFFGFAFTGAAAAHAKWREMNDFGDRCYLLLPDIQTDMTLRR